MSSCAKSQHPRGRTTAWAGQRWIEHDDGAFAKAMQADVRRQAIPFEGPPTIVDSRAGLINPPGTGVNAR